MFALTVLIVSLLILAIIIWWYIEYLRFSSGLRGILGPTQLPVLGNALELKDTNDTYWTIHRFIGEYGTTIKLSAGILFALATVDPDFLDFVMTNTNTINKGRVYNFLKDWLGTGLLTSSEKKWKTRRKLLTPAYHFKILEQFIDVFDQNSNILVKKLKTRVEQDQIDIHPYISLCTLDVISETAMGTSINAQDDEESAFVKAVKDMNRIIVERCVNIPKQFNFIYRFTNDYKIEQAALKVINNYTMSIIKIRREILLKTQKETKEEEDLGIKKRIPFLDLLLMSTIEGASLTDEDIKEEVNTFMFEGHDTVSAGISFCLYLISKHPDIQSKIFYEQKTIFGNDLDRATTYTDLQDMKYLEMVIKEGMRLYPPVPIFTRTFSEDVKYKNWSIRKGTEVALFPYSLHRHPQFYENPEVFDPERFTPENQAKRHPFSYLPFSGGFRNCIGQKFAMLELKSVIGKMIRKFELLEVPNFEVNLKSEIVLSSKNGVMIKIKNRN